MFAPHVNDNDDSTEEEAIPLDVDERTSLLDNENPSTGATRLGRGLPIRLPSAPAPVKEVARRVAVAGERVASSYPARLAHRETWRIRRYAQALGELLHRWMCCCQGRAVSHYASVPEFLGAEAAATTTTTGDGAATTTDREAQLAPDHEAQEWCVMLVYEEGAWAFLCALCRFVECMLAAATHKWHLCVYESVLGTVWLLALPWGAAELVANRRRRCALRIIMSAVVLGVVSGLFVSLLDDLRRVVSGLGGTLDPQTGERTAVSLARALFSFPVDLATVLMFAFFARSKTTLLLPAWEAMGHRVRRPETTKRIACSVYLAFFVVIAVLHFLLRVPALDFLG
ncbi:transmembrane protein [Pseudoscourfieldia marina]